MTSQIDVPHGASLFVIVEIISGFHVPPALLSQDSAGLSSLLITLVP